MTDGYLFGPGKFSDKEIIIEGSRFLLEREDKLTKEEINTLKFIINKKNPTSRDLQTARSILKKHSNYFTPAENSAIRNTNLTNDNLKSSNEPDLADRKIF